MVVCKFAGCNQVYNDARFLPCGKRTCAAHIEAMAVHSEDMSSAHRRTIKCHFCDEIHSFPENGKGFPVDDYIPQLLNMKNWDEHYAAKQRFNEVTQLLDKLIKLDKEDYVIDYFERVEADILLEKEVNVRKMVAHYHKLVYKVQERRVRCLNNLRRNETLNSELEPINRTLKEFDSKLKNDNLDFVLKTMDGDEAKWKQIKIECETMLAKTKSLEYQLTELILGGDRIALRPSTTSTRIEDICGKIDLTYLESSIIRSFKMENDLIKLCKLSKNSEFDLLYRASRDGFEAARFHAKCDEETQTLTIIRTTNGCIFGGFTAIEWDCTSGYKVDPKAFIFSLVNFSSMPLFIPVKSGGKQSIFCKVELGPTFGDGHDIMIWSDSNTSTESYSNLGSSYDFTLFECGRAKAQSFLAGSRNFQVSEIEVFRYFQLRFE